MLPARFPNLLANGASGIAVGMATSIPPHNAGELCDALIHLINHKRASVADLVALVPGPDFPTGGVLVEEPAAVRAAYETGRGSFPPARAVAGGKARPRPILRSSSPRFPIRCRKRG